MSANITDIGTQKVTSVSNGQLSEIASVLEKNNIKLVGIGVEEVGSTDFVNGKFFNGDLYYVENKSTYQLLGFKRFNVVSIITSLFWKQSREAIFKGRDMRIETDTIGDGLQNGGLVVVKSGKETLHFTQAGPADRLANAEILEHFGLLHEYNPETMGNKTRFEAQHTTDQKP